MAEENSLDLDQDPRVIVGTRVLDAPRELVWQVWTDPKHLAQCNSAWQRQSTQT